MIDVVLSIEVIAAELAVANLRLPT